MKNSSLFGLFYVTTLFLFVGGCTAQKSGNLKSTRDIIRQSEVERIENVLASDDMQGRKIFTPSIDKAAAFISSEFKKAGLATVDNNGDYLQSFTMVRTIQVSVAAQLDGKPLDAKEIVVITSHPQLKFNQQSGYSKARISKGANLQTEARKYARSNKNMLVIVDKSFAAAFGNLSRLKSNMFKAVNNVVFVLCDEDPATYNIEAVHEITEQHLANVVGILPGKTKKDEYVIFSGHYDHLGVGKAINGDSIYNGANDDAAGVTGVILLATYFKKLKNNERTIVYNSDQGES